MSDQYDQHVILKTLDNPQRFLFWTIDVVLLFFIIFILGILIHISLLILIIPAKIIYTKIKRRFPRSLIKHKIYWSIPQKAFSQGGNCQKIPPSYIEDILL